VTSLASVKPLLHNFINTRETIDHTNLRINELTVSPSLK